MPSQKLSESDLGTNISNTKGSLADYKINQVNLEFSFREKFNDAYTLCTHKSGPRIKDMSTWAVIVVETPNPPTSM